jgi:hypothetical protein
VKSGIGGPSGAGAIIELAPFSRDHQVRPYRKRLAAWGKPNPDLTFACRSEIDLSVARGGSDRLKSYLCLDEGKHRRRTTADRWAVRCAETAGDVKTRAVREQRPAIAFELDTPRTPQHEAGEREEARKARSPQAGFRPAATEERHSGSCGEADCEWSYWKVEAKSGKETGEKSDERRHEGALQMDQAGGSGSGGESK